VQGEQGENLVSSQDPRYKPLAIRSPRGTRTTAIDWADGHKSIYPHGVLRGYCPCAGCQGHSGEIRFIETSDDLQEIEDFETVGGYALAIKWFDGHNTGIYSFPFLRRLCHCAECHAAAENSAQNATGREPIPRG
jgi:DUF971 family protein